MFVEVRRSPERATVTGRYLVRRSSGISKEKHGGTVNGRGQTRGNVSGLQHYVHDGAHFANGNVYEKAFCQIHMSFRVVCIFFK